PTMNMSIHTSSRGRSLVEVANAIGRAPSTTGQYLAEFIAERHPVNERSWVGDEVYEKVLTAAPDTGAESLKPIFEHLEGRVSYEEIRVVLTHAGVGRNASETPEAMSLN